MKFNKLQFVILVLFLNNRMAAAQTSQVREPDASTAENGSLQPSHGLLMLDYSKISLKGGGRFDLLGVHYLHQLNDWLYLGAGINGPVVEGNYGGFFTVDTSIHAKRRLIGNWFMDAGLALGGGGGGASVRQIKELSGSGRYTKKYVGLAYEYQGIHYGANYSNVKLEKSPLNDSGVNFYIQKPVSFLAGSYSDAGATLFASGLGERGQENIVSFELSHMVQIRPQGAFKGDIGLASTQFSHFVSPNDYVFFGVDLGISGLDWYNQIHAGVGRKLAISPSLNLYGQLGVGTGGWVTDTIDTGPGLLIYPKVKAEYLWSKNTGLSLSAGYLAAPKGSSKNWTVGAAINFHLSADKQGVDDADKALTLNGIRVNLYDKVLLGVSHNGKDINKINMAALQLDYVVSKNWYVPIQINAATNTFQGFAGYAEMFAGLGWQSAYTKSSKLQGFAQISYGMNDLGINKQQDAGPLLNTAMGLNYGLSDQLAIYVQAGKTASLSKYTKSNHGTHFESSSVGLGLTYRFSLPTRGSM